jgi:uncharacterized RDD family membrane protein YckC
MESGTPPEGGPEQPVPPPPPTGPQSPAAPTYGGPVPPGGWQTQAVQQPHQWAQAPLASWGSRLGAHLIDLLVLLVPGLILFIVLVGGAAGVSGADDDVSVGAVIGALILYFIVMAVVVLLYAPLLMARDGPRNGQTWGKQLLNIRVVRDSGEPFGFGSAAMREVVLKFLAVNIASSIIPFIPWFLNYFWPLWDDQNRALHDMAVSTHVITA